MHFERGKSNFPKTLDFGIHPASTLKARSPSRRFLQQQSPIAFVLREWVSSRESFWLIRVLAFLVDIACPPWSIGRGKTRSVEQIAQEQSACGDKRASSVSPGLVHLAVSKRSPMVNR